MLGCCQWRVMLTQAEWLYRLQLSCKLLFCSEIPSSMATFLSCVYSPIEKASSTHYSVVPNHLLSVVILLFIAKFFKLCINVFTTMKSYPYMPLLCFIIYSNYFYSFNFKVKSTFPRNWFFFLLLIPASSLPACYFHPSLRNKEFFKFQPIFLYLKVLERVIPNFLT